jgi:hypothetical protein
MKWASLPPLALFLPLSDSGVSETPSSHEQIRRHRGVSKTLSSHEQIRERVNDIAFTRHQIWGRLSPSGNGSI